MSKNSVILLLSIFLFALCLRISFWVSQKKSLWGDEIHTQARVIDKTSFSDLLLRNFLEGNTNPLFYVVQKSICVLTDFSLEEGQEENWKVGDVRAQFIMRIFPNVCISLAIVLLFAYFSLRYSFWNGIYSVLIFLSTPTIWIYWAEARPYALWVFLSTVQSILMLLLLERKEDKKFLIALFNVNILLSLTIVLSVIQIASVGFLLWVFKKISFKKALVVFGAPMSICILYQIFTPLPIALNPTDQMFSLIFANVSFERASLIGFLAIILLVWNIVEKKENVIDRANLSKTLDVNYFLYFAFMIFFAVALVLKINTTVVSTSHYVSNRYFMFLVPPGIILTVMLTHSVATRLKPFKWVFFNFIMIIIGGVVLQMLKAYYFVLNSKYF